MELIDVLIRVSGLVLCWIMGKLLLRTYLYMSFPSVFRINSVRFFIQFLCCLMEACLLDTVMSSLYERAGK